MQKFYLTTPIYYPNARPHVGSAYTTIVCDAIARYKRMCGYDVALLTGTDEHGEKLERAAAAAGIPVEQFVTEKRELFKELWRTLGISEYRFVHTSQNPAHRAAVHWMIRKAEKAGYIEKKKYEGRYCVFDERYVSDNPEPVNCDICGRPAELISEENYFFRLSAFQERLLKHYEDHPEFVRPDFRMNEVKSFVKSGLRDISISRRRLKWGIPWPGDDEQVVYVWYDALTSYLTGIGFEGERRSKDFEKFWPANLHMIGKDILRFHAVYWPAFLWAAGLQLPETIFAHGWIYYEQDKMSKSKGNVVYPEPIVKAFEEFGAPGNDALRYYLLRDTPFGLDGSFSYEGLIQRYNSELANDLGNLASRVLAMLHQYCDGKVPPAPSDVQTAEGLIQNCKEYYGRLSFAPTLVAIWVEVSRANRSIVVYRPWELAKSSSIADQERLKAALYELADTLRVASVLLYPIMPSSAERLWKQLGCEDYLGKLEDQPIDQLAWDQLKPGTKVGKPEPIFPRVDKAKALARLHELAEQDRGGEDKGQQDAGATEPLFSYDLIAIRSRGRLPHWGIEGGIYFVTFRLVDSLPRSVRDSIESEGNDIVKTAKQQGRDLTAVEQTRLAKLYTERAEAALDAGSGACYLARPEIADLVARAFAQFDGQRYRLVAWCVMPNHVHVVFQQFPGYSLEKILHSWKSFTAKEANAILGKSGDFWEREYYDHLVRDARDLERIVHYVMENPAKANLTNWAWVWRSAGVPPAKERTIKEMSAKMESPNEQKLEAPPARNAEPPNLDFEGQRITIDDFSKVDLRVGTILSAEPIAGATKLLKLQVDIGAEVRQVCAGIAEYYKPEQLRGMKVVIVANLQPRKLRGVESNGMVVAASLGEEGKPVLATFLEDVPNGTRLR